MAENRPGAARPGQPGEAPKIRWDDSKMQSAYANVCNVTSTREEVVLFFGTNQTWHAGGDEVVIQLTNRMIMTPFAAHRLFGLLGNVLKEYEARFGSLKAAAEAGKTDGGPPPVP